MIGWAGIVIAGILNGSFAVPMKTARVWKFSHIWGVFSLLAMVLIPWTAVTIAVPGWHEILSAIPLRRLAALFCLGLIWGGASLLYGLAIDLLGIALGFSIQLGLSIVIGALIPFYDARPLSLETSGDRLFLFGLILMVGGVVVCAQAGGVRQPASRTGFRKGLVVAIAGGIGAPLLNVGIQYGISMLPPGTHGSGAEWVPWAVLLSAAALTQAVICFYRVHVARQGALFRALGAGRDALFVIVMSVVWAVSIFGYGSSAAALGRLGTSVGWPVFIGLIVVTSNAWGVALGEWKERPKRDLFQMLAGSAVLIAATFVVGQARAAF